MLTLFHRTLVRTADYFFGMIGSRRVGFPLSASRQCHRTAEDVAGPIVWVIVRHAACPLSGVVEFLSEPRQVSLVLVVFSAHCERESPSRRKNDTGGQNFYVTLIDLAGRQRFNPVVRVVGLVRFASLRVKSPVGSSEANPGRYGVFGSNAP